ncbi:MAG: prepilin-type N-terminal cleavage/methylation domain-containing protein [Planctomycetes bacterium]|nr:prepilin-type N-terminal cleavage/methylation domain-containing protein [Planctomycetota bacterium]
MSLRKLPDPRAQRGFTLIEILIALVVLFIGIVGIIALFPIGINSTKESIQDTNAALIAESVHHALVQALRTAVPDAAGRIVCLFNHDGVGILGGAVTAPGTANQPGYRFALPLRGTAAPPTMPPAAALTAGSVPEYHHPGNQLQTWIPPAGGANQPGGTDAFGLNGLRTAQYGSEVFRLGDTPAIGGVENSIRQTVQDIRGNLPTDGAGADQPAQLLFPPIAGGTPPDPGNPQVQAVDMSLDYGQYSYDFWVSPVYVNRAGTWEALPLYQFRIRVFRNYLVNPAAIGVPGGTANLNATFMRPDAMIHEFRVLIASNS